MNIRKFSEKNKTNWRSGITLIELVIVIALVSFLVVFIASALPALFKPSYSVYAERLHAIINFTYRYSSLNNINSYLELDIDKQTVTLYVFDASSKGLEKKQIQQINFPENSRIMKIYDIRKVEYTTGIVEIPFNYDGVSENFVICIGNDDQINVSVRIYKYKGKVEILQGEKVDYETIL